jgi:hypothetical protein
VRKSGELKAKEKMRAARLQELEEMAANLVSLNELAGLAMLGAVLADHSMIGCAEGAGLRIVEGEASDVNFHQHPL